MSFRIKFKLYAFPLQYNAACGKEVTNPTSFEVKIRQRSKNQVIVRVLLRQLYNSQCNSTEGSWTVIREKESTKWILSSLQAGQP